MTLRYLLDTNALAEPVKPTVQATFMRRLSANSGACAIASVTWHEALFGVARLPDGARRRALHAYLHDVVKPTLPILAYDEAAAAWHAEERARRERIGRPLPFADGQIAAIARQHGLIVVTANVGDFADIAGVEVQDWTAPSF